MKSFPIVNLAKEDWANPRRARKQLLFEALIKQSEVEEVLYLEPPRHFWHSRPKVNSSKKGIKVLQNPCFIPGERFSYVRAVNRTISYILFHRFFSKKSLIAYRQRKCSWSHTLKRLLIADTNIMFFFVKSMR